MNQDAEESQDGMQTLTDVYIILQYMMIDCIL